MSTLLESNVTVPEQAIAALRRRNGIRRLAFFGSALRQDFRPDSDVDVLVEFEKGRTAGCLALSAMEIELGALLARRVDLRTPAERSRYFRDEAASRVTAELREAHPEIPRGPLVHAHFDIDHERVRDTVSDDLPSLVSRIEAILPGEAPTQEGFS